MDGRMHFDDTIHAACAHRQAYAVHHLDVLGVTVHQPDFIARFGQHAADGATQGACAQDANFQFKLLLVDFEGGNGSACLCAANTPLQAPCLTPRAIYWIETVIRRIIRFYLKY